MLSGPAHLTSPEPLSGSAEENQKLWEQREALRGVSILGELLFGKQPPTVWALQRCTNLWAVISKGEQEKIEISSVQVKISKLLCTVTFVPCIFWMDKFLIKVQNVSSRASADILPALLSKQLLQPPPCSSTSHHIHGCSTFSSSRWYNSCICKPSAFQSRFFSLIATTQLRSVIFPTHIFNTPSKS